MRSTDQDERPRSSNARWLWLIVAAAAAVVKVRAWAELLHHRDVVLVVLAAAVLAAILRARPVSLAAAAATLFAVLMRPPTFAHGLADGAAGFAAVMSLFLVLVGLVELRGRVAERRARTGPIRPAAVPPPRPDASAPRR